MDVMVTGAGGQLGLDLLDAFADHTVAAFTHAELDVADEAAVATAVDALRPALVVNAAAWTDVDGCEADPQRSHRVNALGPWWLARACARTGATLVTFSTDYVFGGAAPVGPDGRPRAWSEWDQPAPVNAYGRAKLAGEVLVRESLAAHHIVRTSWVAGARGRSFVTAVLETGRREGRVGIVEGQVGAPTLSRDLAAAVRRLAVSGRYGTVHLVNEGCATRRELAAAALELAGVEAEITAPSEGMLAGRAPRPAWSVLDTTHARQLGLGLPDWREGLAALIAEMQAG